MDETPVFYSSIEIKYELERYVQQIRSSQMMGLILSDTDCFVLYNLHQNKLSLSPMTELRTSAIIGDGTMIKIEDNSDAIFLVNDFDVASDLILGNQEKNFKPDKVVNSDAAFKRCYIIPETSDGDVQLQMLCNQGLRAIIDNTMSRNFKPRQSNYIIENDGFDSKGLPVINGCHLEVNKMMRFKRGLLAYNLTGRILCYEFQKDFIKRLMTPAIIKFNTIAISDVREIAGI